MGKVEDSLNLLRELGDEDLKSRLSESRKELFALRTLTWREGKTNPARIRALKKEIARILTILKERELSKKAQNAVDGQQGSDREMGRRKNR